MCKKRLLLAMIMFATMLTVTACATRIIRGSGNVITETRQVSNFGGIDLSGSGEVIVTQGGSESLSIETDDNVMKHVKAVVEGGILKLGFEDGFNIISTSRLIFYVGVDDLSSLNISGSGDIESDMLQTDRLEVSVSGSGDVQIGELSAGSVNAWISGSGEIELIGDAASQDVNISGSGKYLTGDMCSKSVKVNISGSGNATVCATETLDSNISGSGSVHYYGRPSVNTVSSGSGTITNLGEK